MTAQKINLTFKFNLLVLDVNINQVDVVIMLVS